MHIMKRLLVITIFASMLLRAAPALAASTAELQHTAQPGAWNLPQQITDQNMKVDFEVDSTWHLIHGHTSGLSGRVWLENEANLRSVRAELKIPILKFNTDSEKRDTRLREVMHQPEHPEVIVRISNTAFDCQPKPSHPQPCPVKLLGNISLSGTTKEVVIPATLSYEGSEYTITGSLPIVWSEYGVEDPSIFIAKLDPLVTVHFSLGLGKAA